MNTISTTYKQPKRWGVPIKTAVTAMVCLLLANSAHARPNTNACPTGNTITKTFSSGAAWDLCWEVRAEEGVVLSDIHYKSRNGIRRRVLGEASLSQIQTEYDDGSATEYLVTQFGLGGSNLQTLTPSMCEGGTLRSNDGRNVLCEVTKATGLIYRYRNIVRQGSKLELFSASNVNSREFILNWSFFENGTIEVGSGLTGRFTKTTTNNDHGWQVTAQNKIATAFTDHYFWRLDFDIDSTNSNDIIEQIISSPSSNRLTKSKNIQTVTQEAASRLSPSTKKFWRVKDQTTTSASNQNISYEMVLMNYGPQSYGNNNSAWLKNDVFITRYDACQRFAVQNPTNNNCASDVSKFVSGQDINAKDVVVWYRLARHTLPRDEDFSPASTQWNKFILLPRDWTSRNSL